MNTPTAFKTVIGSLKNMAAAIIVKTGVSVTTIEASTGEVDDSPVTKLIWLRAIPRNEAAIIINTSFFDAFGALNKNAAIQNTKLAPMNRKNVSARGEIENSLPKTDLVIGVLNPKIKLTAIMAICPQCACFIITKFEFAKLRQIVAFLYSHVIISI